METLHHGYAEREMFVGRADELDELQAVVDRGRTGRGTLALVGGEPGIGKTRLVEEVAAYASAEGSTVLWGTCWEGSLAPAFWPWSQLLRRCLRQRDLGSALAAESPARAELARLVPELGPGPGISRPGASEPDAFPLRREPEHARFRLYESVLTFLAQVAAEQPVVAVLDDLHWADPPSLHLLAFVARELRGSKMALLGTYRDVELTDDHPLAETLAALPRDVTRVPLGGLGDEEVGELASTLAGREVRPELADAMYARTGGNPFFVREIVRLLVAQKRRDVFEGGTLRLHTLPKGIQEVTDRRLARLPSDCVTLLETAAVAGQMLDVDVLVAVTGAPRGDVLELVDVAQRARVVTALPGAALRYAFSHALLRDALCARLPVERRISLHRAVAEALEEVHVADIDEHAAQIAYHLDEAGPEGSPEAAVRYSELAGNRAMAMLAYEAAADHFRRALDSLAPSGRADVGEGGEERRCELLLAEAQARSLAGATAEARVSFKAAALLAREHGDGPRLAQAAIGYGTRYQFVGLSGADAELVSLLEDALALLPEGENELLRTDTLARLAHELVYSEPERARQMSEEVSSLAGRLGDPRARLRAIWLEDHFLHGSPQAPARVQLNTEAIHLARDLGDVVSELVARIDLVVALVELGDIDRVDREIHVFSELAERFHLPAYCWHPELWRAMRALLRGQVSDAEVLALQALEAGAALGQHAVDHYGIQLLAIRREQGRLAELIPFVAESVDRNPQLPAYRCCLAFVLAETGHVAWARSELARLSADDFAGVPREYSWLISAAMLAEACALLEDGWAAGRLYELLRPHEGLCVFVAQAAVCLGSVDRYLALCACAAGRRADAAAHFEAALGTNARIGAPGILARTRYEYARMLLTGGDGHGDRERAEALLTEAAEAASELGLDDLRSKVAALEVVGGAPRKITPNVFRREGELWTLTYKGVTVRMKDAKGLRDVAALVASPGREVHVTDLIAGTERASQEGVPQLVVSEEALSPWRPSSHPVLDGRARAEYRARLRELQEELEEAGANHDTGRASKAREEMDVVAGELASALGLGGQARQLGSRVERARKTILQRVHNTLARIDQVHPDLAGHLRRSIRTGVYCSYSPESPVSWRL